MKQRLRKKKKLIVINNSELNKIIKKMHIYIITRIQRVEIKQTKKNRTDQLTRENLSGKSGKL